MNKLVILNKTRHTNNMPEARNAFRIILLMAIILLTSVFTGLSQRFAYVNSDYILNNIPDFKAAQEQLDRLTQGWQQEVEAKYEEVGALYRSFQQDRVLMSEEMRKKREDEIISREAAAADLQRKYFGPEGELFNSQEELIRPIQDRIYKAVEKLASDNNYAVIFDTADSPALLYTNPRNDVSDDVLRIMGYRN